MMDVPDQLSKENILLEVKDGIVGFPRERFVNEFEQQARSNQQGYQHDGHAAETPREGQSEGSIRHGAGAKVEDQTVEKPSVTLSILYGALCARKNRKSDSLKDGQFFWCHLVLCHRSILSNQVLSEK